MWNGLVLNRMQKVNFDPISSYWILFLATLFLQQTGIIRLTSNSVNSPASMWNLNVHQLFLSRMQIYYSLLTKNCSQMYPVANMAIRCKDKKNNLGNLTLKLHQLRVKICRNPKSTFIVSGVKDINCLFNVRKFWKCQSNLACSFKIISVFFLAPWFNPLQWLRGCEVG